MYPAREEHGRWRAVWHENGERQRCEAASEEKLAARLAKVADRLEADAPNMTLRGAEAALGAGWGGGLVTVLTRSFRQSMHSFAETLKSIAEGTVTWMTG